MKQMDQSGQQSNPYEFIMNPQQPKRRWGLKGSFLTKLALIGVGVVLLLVILGAIISTAFRGSTVDIEGLVGLAQTQQELVRLASQGAASTSQSSLRDLSVTTQLSVDTNRLQLLDYLQANGRKVTTKELNAKRDTETDARLAAAVQTSTFDSVYTQTIQESLVIYNTEVEQAQSRAVGKLEKQLLAKTKSAAELLLKQIPPIETVQPGS